MSSEKDEPIIVADLSIGPLIVPRKDKDGNEVLFDMYLNDKWLGSKRTRAYAEEYLEWLTRKSS